MKYHPAANIFPLMGDSEFTELKEDMRVYGQIEDITRHDGTILDGRNRYRACKELGIRPRYWDYEGDESDALAFVISMNLKRRHLNESQRAMVAARLEETKQGRPGKDANLHLNREKASGMLNVSPRATATAKAVQEHAVDEVVALVDVGEVSVSDAAAVAKMPEEDQRKAVKLVKKGEASNLKDAKRQLKRDETKALADETELPAGTYRTIVIDPPWAGEDTGDQDSMGRGKPNYSTMRISELKELPIEALAEEGDCHLYLWVTNRILPKAFQLLTAWGFEYKTMLTWCKSIGLGFYFRNSTEHVLFATKGTRMLSRADVGTWFMGKRDGEHSTKPQEFYDLVKSVSAGPMLEMFARGKRKGWKTWGAEA